MNSPKLRRKFWTIKKFLGIFILGLFLCNTSFAAPAYYITKKYWGAGSLKLNKRVADTLEYYFSGGTMGVYAEKQKEKWKPGFIVISMDGKHSYFFRLPLRVVGRIDNAPHYVGMARKGCKKRSGGVECKVFANEYKILWDNGINNKKKLTKKEIRAGKTLQILQELGFYDDSVTPTPKKIEKKKVEKKKEKKKEPKKKTDDDIVQQLKELNEMYKSGVLTKEEFEKAKKKLLN